MTVLQRRDATMVVHAAKLPNVFRRPYGTLVEGECSTTRFTSSYRQRE
jgi:hypothetical protein